MLMHILASPIVVHSFGMIFLPSLTQSPPLQFVNLMALMAAWVYIFDTIQKEREALEGTERDVYAEAEAGRLPGEVSAQCMLKLRWCCCNCVTRR